MNCKIKQHVFFMTDLQNKQRASTIQCMQFLRWVLFLFCFSFLDISEKQHGETDKPNDRISDRSHSKLSLSLKVRFVRKLILGSHSHNLTLQGCGWSNLQSTSFSFWQVGNEINCFMKWTFKGNGQNKKNVSKSKSGASHILFNVPMHTGHFTFTWQSGLRLLANISCINLLFQVLLLAFLCHWLCCLLVLECFLWSQWAWWISR